MQIFYDEIEAKESLQSKDKVFLNSKCPFNDGHMCGSWCALFYISSKASDSRYIILGCKGTDKRLYVE